MKIFGYEIPERNPFEWRAMHHIYVGLMCMIFGWLGMGQTWSYELGQVFFGIGALIFADDLIEHTICGTTPLRLLFDKILAPLVQKIFKK